MSSTIYEKKEKPNGEDAVPPTGRVIVLDDPKSRIVPGEYEFIRTQRCMAKWPNELGPTVEEKALVMNF